MWLDNLNKKIIEKNMSHKQIAEQSYLSEKTVKRILTGVSKSTPMVNIIAIANTVGCSLDEVFEMFVGTQATLSDISLAKLQQECDGYKEQLNLANAEICQLKSQLAELEVENKMLKKEIDFKDQIIEVHNYYNRKGEK